MAERPRLRLSTVVLDAPDATTLADFYRRLLGWPVERAEDHWVKLSSPDGGVALSFQTESAYARPTWPAGVGTRDDVRVYLDPAGHPFCLWIAT